MSPGTALVRHHARMTDWRTDKPQDRTGAALRGETCR